MSTQLNTEGGVEGYNLRLPRDSQQVLPVLGFLQFFAKLAQSGLVDPAILEGDFFWAADLQALAALDRANELGNLSISKKG